jgi:carbonic anhydrase
MNRNDILQRLTEGNRRYVADKAEGKLNDSQRRNDILEGQAPFAIVLSCADSRVVPELIFDTGLGELFVVRVAGNVANTSSIASIEYAVAHLGTKVLLVLGHEHCGAVTAAVNGGDNGENINYLLAHIAPAIENTPEEATVDEVIRKNVHLTAEELIRRSAIIADAANKDKLKIVTAYYHLGSGKVEFIS